MWILVPNIDVPCFVVRQLLPRIYALFRRIIWSSKNCAGVQKLTNYRYAEKEVITDIQIYRYKTGNLSWSITHTVIIVINWEWFAEVQKKVTVDASCNNLIQDLHEVCDMWMHFLHKVCDMWMHFLQFANSKNCVSHGQQAWVRFHLLSDIHLVTENSCLAECFFLPSSDEEIYRLCVNLSPPPYIIHFCEALSNGHAFRLGNILDGQFFLRNWLFCFLSWCFQHKAAWFHTIFDRYTSKY